MALCSTTKGGNSFDYEVEIRLPRVTLSANNNVLGHKNNELRQQINKLKSQSQVQTERMGQMEEFMKKLGYKPSIASTSESTAPNTS